MAGLFVSVSRDDQFSDLFAEALLDSGSIGSQTPVFSQQSNRIWQEHNGLDRYQHKGTHASLLIHGDARPPCEAEAFIEQLISDPSRALQTLDGCFQLILLLRDGRCLCAFDRLGSSLSYWTLRKEGLLLASENACFLKQFPDLHDPDPAGVAGYLHFRAPTGSKSLWKGISVSPPGTWAWLKAHEEPKWTKWSHWQIEESEISFEAAADRFAELLMESVRKDRLRIPQDKRVGAYLSGGLDSRGLVMALHGQDLSLPVLTFEAEYGEVKAAKRVAKALGLSQTLLPLDMDFLENRGLDYQRACSGELSLMYAHTLPLSRVVRESYDYMYDGNFGDQISVRMPLWMFDAFENLHDVNELHQLVNYRIGHLERDDRQALLRSPMMAQGFEFIENEFKSSVLASQGTWLKRYIAYKFEKGWALRRSMLGARNQRVHLGLRMPYLDPDLVAFCLTVPSHYHIQQRLYLAAFDRINSSVAMLPTAAAGVSPLSPKWKYKLGRVSKRLRASISRTPSFASCVDQGLQKHFASDFKTFSKSPLLAEFGLIDGNICRKAFHGIQEQSKKSRYYNLQIFSLELWFRRTMNAHTGDSA
jgi:asparagine synthetase B (glutamine-hydrolysing)